MNDQQNTVSMSVENQQKATAANADVMSELTGSDVSTGEAARRRNSVEQASVIAQDGDVGAPGAGGNTANESQGQTANTRSTETPAVRPPAASGAASPVKPAPGSPVVASTALQGHARQDLNDKLDDLAPDAGQPGSHDTAEQSQEQPAAPSTAANGDKENAMAQASSKLTEPKGPQDAPTESIKALRDRFTGTSDTNPPQPRASVPLPKEANATPPPLTLEVQHKPGSKSFSYKELRELRLEDGIDPTCKEEYLTDDEFTEVFKKWSPDRDQFKKQPLWRQRMQKQAVGLF